MILLRAVAVTVAVWAVSATAAPRLDQLQLATALTLKHNYSRATEVADSLIAADPKNPDAHLQKAATLFTWVDDFGTTAPFDSSLISELTTAADLAKARLDTIPDDNWSLFFLGSAELYHGLYLVGRDGFSLSLVSHALSGMDALESAARLAPQLTEPLIPLGSILCWRATALSWVPFQSSKRGEGIAMLKRAIDTDTYGRAGAIQRLAYALYDDDRFEEALEVARMGEGEFPQSRFFSQIEARILLAMGQYQESDALYNRILSNLSPTEAASDFIRMKYMRYLAKSKLLRGENKEACSMCAEIRSWEYDGVSESWLKPKMRVLSDIEDLACN